LNLLAALTLLAVPLSVITGLFLLIDWVRGAE
jgi:hypothetical protein